MTTAALAPCAVPRVLTDAVEVAAHPERYSDRPSLVRLAVLVRMSALGRTPRQSTLPRGPAPARRTGGR